MLDEDLGVRAVHLANGIHRVEDLDRLFLGLRDKKGTPISVREIGDFVAHRGERHKGMVTQTARDTFTSVDVWSMPMRGVKQSKTDVSRAAHANFRLASDEQLKMGCKLRRSIVKRRLESGLKKFMAGESLNDQEATILSYLGNRFLWRPAFDEERLFREFCDALLHNAFIQKTESASLVGAKTFVTLYCVALMHGAAIELENGMKAQLRAGFANRQRLIEVKIMITFEELSKPLFAPICMFLTSLESDAHCSTELIELGQSRLPDAWQAPIKVSPEGKLRMIS